MHFHMISVIKGEIYGINNGAIKSAKRSCKGWPNISNCSDYEIFITAHTTIELLPDQNPIEYETDEIKKDANEFMIKNEQSIDFFKYRKLNELSSVVLNSFINVIGVILSVDRELKNIDTKNGPLKLRNFLISDITEAEISVALWGTQAEDFCHPPGTVLEFRSIKLTKYYHKFSLSIQRSTFFEIVDRPDSSELKDFWSKHKMNVSREQ